MFSFLYLESSLSYQIVKQENIGPGEVEMVRFSFTPEGTAYPKFILFSDRIEARNPQAQTLAQNPFVHQKGVDKSIVVSNEGRYFAWIENHYPPPPWKDQEGTQVITLYNEAGQVVRTCTWPTYEDIPPPGIEISDYDGTLAASYSSGYLFDTLLYRPDGREIPYSEWPPLQKEGTPYFNDFDFAHQAPLLGAIGGRSGRPQVSVILFDLDGKLLWEQELNKENPRERPRFIRLSPKGSFALARTGAVDKKAEGEYTAETRLYLFDKAGRLLMKRFFSGDWNNHRRVYSDYVYAVGFSPQERFVGIALTDEVLVWDLTKGAEVYRASLPDPGMERRQTLRISVNDLGEALVLVGNRQKVAIGQRSEFRRGANPQAFLFSEEGLLRWKRAFRAPAKDIIAPLLFRLLKPEIRSRSDLEILLTDKDIYLFIDNTFYHIRRIKR